MLLLVLIVILAAVGGFLGDLLELAFWIVLILVALGGILGYLLYRWFEDLRSRLSRGGSSQDS